MIEILRDGLTLPEAAPRLEDLRILLTHLSYQPEPLNAEEERLVRQGAHRYASVMDEIRREMETPDPDPEIIRAFAVMGLDKLPEDEDLYEGEHVSVRMCAMIAADRFMDLLRILEASRNKEDVLEAARKRVLRAYAKIGLR